MNKRSYVRPSSVFHFISTQDFMNWPWYTSNKETNFISCSSHFYLLMSLSLFSMTICSNIVSLKRFLRDEIDKSVKENSRLTNKKYGKFVFYFKNLLFYQRVVMKTREWRLKSIRYVRTIRYTRLMLPSSKHY